MGDLKIAKRKKKGKGINILNVLLSNAAGIDIGATEIYIAVPEDRTQKSIRYFSIFIPSAFCEDHFDQAKTSARYALYFVIGTPWSSPHQAMFSKFRSL